MNGHPLEVSIEDLITGRHEGCHFCGKPFPQIDGKLSRFKGIDGNYYCSVTHGSAPYLTPRRTQ